MLFHFMYHNFLKLRTQFIFHRLHKLLIIAANAFFSFYLFQSAFLPGDNLSPGRIQASYPFYESFLNNPLDWRFLLVLQQYQPTSNATHCDVKSAKSFGFEKAQFCYFVLVYFSYLFMFLLLAKNFFTSRSKSEM